MESNQRPTDYKSVALPAELKVACVFNTCKNSPFESLVAAGACFQKDCKNNTPVMECKFF